MSNPRTYVARLRRRAECDPESGQVAVGVLLTALMVIAATFAFMVFAEAVDLRGSTRKGADSAATAAAESARSTWIETWLRAQRSAPVGAPEDGLYDDRAPGDDRVHEDDDRDFEYSYSTPEPFWGMAAVAAQPTAATFASRNDGGTLTKYLPEGGNRISVSVHRGKDTASPQADRFVPRVAGTSSATARVITPPGLTCVPLPNGTWSSWTLQCTSAKGTATAVYEGAMLVWWDERAFEKMYTITLDR